MKNGDDSAIIIACRSAPIRAPQRRPAHRPPKDPQEHTGFPPNPAASIVGDCVVNPQILSIFFLVAPLYIPQMLRFCLTSAFLVLYPVDMLRFLQYLVVFSMLCLAGCTVHFKGKEIELDTKPVEPGLKMSNHTYELEKIALLER